jgi:hypothetical protein
LIADGYDGTATVNPQASGLPESRIAGGFLLGDYAGKNAVQLRRGDVAPVEISVPPRRYAAVKALVSGGNGDSEILADLVYADGSTSQALIYCNDWQDDEVDTGPGGKLQAELRTVLDGMDGIVDGTFFDANDFGLFAGAFTADPDATLVKIILRPEQHSTAAGGTRYATTNTRFNLFAMIGLAEPEEPKELFHRGDADGSGQVTITDPIRVLNFLFLGAEAPVCFDAADANDSGAIDLTDAVSVLNFLFLGSRPPADPGPDACGVDPTPDGLAPCPADSCVP